PAADGGVRARLPGDAIRRPPARAGPHGPGAHPGRAPALPRGDRRPAWRPGRGQRRLPRPDRLRGTGGARPPGQRAARLAAPAGMAPWIVNLGEWAWHVLDRLHQEVVRNPSDRLKDLVTELEELVPDRPRQPGPDYLGFAVPLRLRSGDGELRLLTTLTHFATPADVTIA